MGNEYLIYTDSACDILPDQLLNAWRHPLHTCLNHYLLNGICPRIKLYSHRCSRCWLDGYTFDGIPNQYLIKYLMDELFLLPARCWQLCNRLAFQ